MKAAFCFLTIVLVMEAGPVAAGQEAPQANTPPSAADLISQVAQSMALILVGDGNGRVQNVSTGVIVRSDGTLLTAYHVISGAREVQVRLRNGEVYDQVEVMGFDQRRDVAALHIAATGLPAVATAALDGASMGDKIHVLNADATMSWSTTDGVLGPMRLADELAGAGHGFRVVQFMSACPQGLAGGAVVNSRGELLGIITASPASAAAQFAVPVESVAGLETQNLRLALGTGMGLSPVVNSSGQGTGPRGQTSPASALAKARTLCVISKTTFFNPGTLDKELLNDPGFSNLGLGLVGNVRKGDLVVKVDRPLFTYDWTYSVNDVDSGTVFAAGKVTALDGARAAKGIARKLIQDFERARLVQQAQTNPGEVSNGQQ